MHATARVRKDGEKSSGKIRLAFTGLAQNNFLQRGGKKSGEASGRTTTEEMRSEASSTKHQSIIQ